MIKPNKENSKHQFLGTQKTPSNTHLNHHATLSLSTNSFKSSSPLQVDSHSYLKSLSIHLDYLRVSTTNLNKRDLDNLLNSLFSKVDYKIINKPWYPDSKMPKSKKYQNRISSKIGIVLGYTKRAKFKGRNTRHVYDIMIDFTGAYFVHLGLVEQLKLIYYLNSNWKLKCHRIDIAIDDYSRDIFPVCQMISAYLDDNQYGFKVINDDYLDIINNKFVGTLGLGSRHSSFFVRIYTLHEFFVRWETELKQTKAQNLFDYLADSSQDKLDSSLFIKTTQEALVNAAIGKIDFRDNSKYTNLRHASRSKTDRLYFWQLFIDEVSGKINNQADIKHLKDG